MKKSLLSLCFSFLLSLPLVSLAQTKKIDKANEKLNTILTNLQKLNSLEVVFSLEINDASNKKIASQTGLARVQKDKYELQVGDQNIYSDGSTIWIYNKTLNEVQINNNIKDGSNLLDVQTLFTGQLQKSQFLSKLNDNANINGKACEEIEMTPVDKTKPYFKVILWVDEKTKTIEKAKVFDKTGTRYIYTTKKMKKNVAFEKTFGKFLVTNHPGVETVDLR